MCIGKSIIRLTLPSKASIFSRIVTDRPMPLITYREALKQALSEEIERDENVVILGEEVAQYNGAYKVTEGLWKKYGDKRLVDNPIREAGFIGMGVGAAMLGLRPAMELMFFSLYKAPFAQIFKNAANLP